MFGKTLPKTTEVVNVEVTVKDEHGVESTVTEKKTVDLSEESYRAALTKLIPPESLSSMVKSRIKEYQKEVKQHRAGNNLAFNSVLSHMTKEAREQCESIDQSDRVFADMILVGTTPDAPSLRRCLILIDNELSTGVCAPMAVASALAGYCTTIMKKGDNFNEYYERVVDKSEAVHTAKGGFYDLQNFKGLLAKEGATSMSDRISISSFVNVLKTSSQKVMATIALHQCRDGHGKFYDSRLNSWHDGNSQALPDTLSALRVAAARFSDTSSKEQGAAEGNSSGNEASSFASAGEAALRTHNIRMHQWAGVKPGHCFRCGGDHHLKDCEVTAEQVASLRDNPAGSAKPAGSAEKDGGAKGGAADKTGTTATTAHVEDARDDEEVDQDGAFW